jgi:hypothetical protein
MIKVIPQWEGIEVRREHDMIRSATLRFDIYSTSNAILEWEEVDTALGTLSLPIILGCLHRTQATAEQIAPGLWEGVVEYEYKNTDEFKYSFETTGGTQHLTQSYKTIGRFAPSGRTPPNHHGAIGVNDKGDVAGCEVIIPTLSFSMFRTKTGVLDPAFIKFVASMTGKINATPFMGFFPGEVLFEGASGSQKFTSEEFPSFDLTYKFKVSPNTEDLCLGEVGTDGYINVGYKYGWDYFWVQYEEYAETHGDTEDEEECTISKRPIAAFIEQVYHDAELNLLL